MKEAANILKNFKSRKHKIEENEEKFRFTNFKLT